MIRRVIAVTITIILLILTASYLSAKLLTQCNKSSYDYLML